MIIAGNLEFSVERLLSRAPPYVTDKLHFVFFDFVPQGLPIYPEQ